MKIRYIFDTFITFVVIEPSVNTAIEIGKCRKNDKVKVFLFLPWDEDLCT